MDFRLLLVRQPFGESPVFTLAYDERLQCHYAGIWSCVEGCPCCIGRGDLSERCQFTADGIFYHLLSDFEDYLNETYFETDYMEHYAPPMDTAIFE